MYWDALVPAGFAVPERFATGEFVLRMLTVNDVVRDYDAVISSAGHLRGLMKPASAWPEGLTLEHNLIDLGWHQREFTMRRSFAYTVMAPDGARCLGCCYIYPTDSEGFDAEAYYWAREDRLADGLEERLGRAFRDWLAQDWPFAQVAFPGRGDPYPPGRA